MERCESGRIGRFRKPLSRKAPGVRIPLSPIRRRGNIAAGDSKRGPADLREEKGTEGGPGGANPPLSDKKERGLFIVFILYLTCKSIDLEW